MSLLAEQSRSRSLRAQVISASIKPEIRSNTSLAFESCKSHPYVLPESSGEDMSPTGEGVPSASLGQLLHPPSHVGRRRTMG